MNKGACAGDEALHYQQTVEQPDSDVIHVRMSWEGASHR